MVRIGRRLLLSFSATLCLAATASASKCDTLIANFKSAISDKSIAKMRDAMGAIADDSARNFDIDAYRLQEIDFAIEAAGSAPTEGTRNQIIEFAQDAIRIGGTWGSAETMGDYYARRGQFADALRWYETGISFLSRASTSSTPRDREQLLARARGGQASGERRLRGPAFGGIRVHDARCRREPRGHLFPRPPARRSSRGGSVADQFFLRRDPLHAGRREGDGGVAGGGQRAKHRNHEGSERIGFRVARDLAP
jgi:hypothetical protein